MKVAEYVDEGEVGLETMVLKEERCCGAGVDTRPTVYNVLPCPLSLVFMTAAPT